MLPDQDFELKWDLVKGANARLTEIEAALNNGSGQTRRTKTGATSPRLVLATDPDREGEAISWHLLEELQVRMCGLLEKDYVLSKAIL